MTLAQPLKPTGHRRVGEDFKSGEESRHEAAMPKDDAHANKSYFGPSGLLKGSGSGRHKTALNAGATPIQQAGRFQKARQRRK